MSKKTLTIIQTAYRGTLEEQDDPIVWLSHVLKGQGAELDVLLRGNAVNYAVAGQDASGLSFGDKRQTHPPRLDADLSALHDKGVELYYLEDDAQKLGIRPDELIPGVKAIRRGALPELFEGYERIWGW